MTPALLTRTSRPPKELAASSTTRSHSPDLAQVALDSACPTPRRSISLTVSLGPSRCGRSGRRRRRPRGPALWRSPARCPSPRPSRAPSCPRGRSSVRLPGSLALLPALGEQVEVDVFLRVGGYDLLVELDAEARSLSEERSSRQRLRADLERCRGPRGRRSR